MIKPYFVTAIGTDSGKTLISAMLVEGLGADYWKPVQAGAPHDTDQVKALVSRNDITFHHEQYVLHTPASPHAAAAIDRVTISLDAFSLPSTPKSIIIEGAGGALVPLNDQDMVIDIAQRLGTEVILISNLYLGSINHTLLTFQELKRRGLSITGIIFNGPKNPESQRIILHHTNLRCLGHIPPLSEVTPEIIKYHGQALAKEILQ